MNRILTLILFDEVLCASRFLTIRSLWVWWLRLLTKCFILVGSAMFGATFNLVTHVG